MALLHQHDMGLPNNCYLFFLSIPAAWKKWCPQFREDKLFVAACSYIACQGLKRTNPLKWASPHIQSTVTKHTHSRLCCAAKRCVSGLHELPSPIRPAAKIAFLFKLHRSTSSGASITCCGAHRHLQSFTKFGRSFVNSEPKKIAKSGWLFKLYMQVLITHLRSDVELLK